MASEHARIRRDIWADSDFRRLTSPAQWLYMHLLTSPALSFAGVTDWRPPRIAALTADLSAHDIDLFGGELIQAHFVLIDVDTEEALIRSWVKHDGLLRSPNMTRALVKAHGRTASNVLRRVIVDQLRRLHDRGHEGCWDICQGLLEGDALGFDEGVELLSVNGSVNPSAKGSGRVPKGSVNPSAKGSGNPFENRASLHSPYSFLHSPSSSSDLICTEDREVDGSSAAMMPLRAGGIG